MRSPISLFVLFLFSSGAIVVNCDDSADNNNNSQWDSYLFWFGPKPTEEQRVTQPNSEEKTFPPHPSDDLDFPLFPFTVFPDSTVVSSHAISSSSFSDDNNDDMEQKENILPKKPVLTENIPNRSDPVMPKSTSTVPESVVSSDCKGKQSEFEEFDIDLFTRLLELLSIFDDLKEPITIEKEKELVADPNFNLFKDFYGYSTMDKDSEKPSTREKFAVEEDIEAYSSNKLPEKKTLTPSTTDTEVWIAEPDTSFGFVPLEKITTVGEEIDDQSEATSGSVRRNELNIADEQPKATAVEENEQHDATGDERNKEKDYGMPRISFYNALKEYLKRW